MNDAKLAKRYGVLASGVLVGKLVTFASAAVVGRALGREGLGVYGTAVTLTGFLLIASNAGLDSIGTRDAAKSPEQVGAVARGVTRLRLALGLLLGFVAFAIVLIAGGPIKLALPLCLAGITLALRNDWALIAIGADRAVALTALIRELVFLLLAITVVATTRSVVAAAWAYIAADLAWAVATRAFSRSLPRSASGKFQPSLSLLREGWPIALMGFMSLTYNKIDTPLITLMRGPKDAGVYYAAYTVVFGALSVIAPFARLVLPEMAAGAGCRHEEGMRATVRLCVFASIVGAGLGLLLVSSAGLILTTLYGRSFQLGTAALGILGWILVLNFPSSILLQRLIVDGRQRAMAGIAGVAAVVNVTANLVLIPRLGIEGAALATVASEATLLMLPILLYAKVYAMRPFIERMTWVGAAALCAWALGRFLFLQSPVLGVVATLTSYGLLLVPLIRSLRQPGALAQ